VDFYNDLSGRIVAGGLLSLIAIALFVVFASALRSILIELEKDELLANVAFGGALLALATGLGAETINMAAALRAGDGELTQSLAKALFDTSYVLGYNAAGVGMGLLVLATATETPSLLSRALSLPPLVFLGQISYSLYLWHPMILSFGDKLLGIPRAAGVLISLGVATA